jgi:glycerol-3-phosphate cytidylyltransferase
MGLCQGDVSMRLGVIAGNFDIIHPGYMKMFKECKANCDKFMVFLHTDPTIERPEKIKPILSVEERTEILQGIRYIDEIVPYNTEHDLWRLLILYNPSIRFLGEDYKDKNYTGKGFCPVYWINRDHGWSTTKFKKLIADTI